MITHIGPWDISAEGEGNNVTAYLDGQYYETLYIQGTGRMRDFRERSISLVKFKYWVRWQI